MLRCLLLILAVMQSHLYLLPDLLIYFARSLSDRSFLQAVLQCRFALAGECSALWQIRMANPQTPDSFFKNWRNVSDTDTSCCAFLSPDPRAWFGVRFCAELKVRAFHLDGLALPPAQRPSVLPDSIAQLTKLESLNLLNLNIARLPPVAFSSITEVHIVSTLITSIGPICSMTTLHTIDVRNNSRLSSVDCSFAEHTNLRLVNFAYNVLSSFSAFDLCDAITYCDICGLELYLEDNQVISRCTLFSNPSCIVQCGAARCAPAERVADR